MKVMMLMKVMVTLKSLSLPLSSYAARQRWSKWSGGEDSDNEGSGRGGGSEDDEVTAVVLIVMTAMLMMGRMMMIMVFLMMVLLTYHSFSHPLSQRRSR